jgi:hypothetical protein
VKIFQKGVPKEERKPKIEGMMPERKFTNSHLEVVLIDLLLLMAYHVASATIISSRRDKSVMSPLTLPRHPPCPIPFHHLTWKYSNASTILAIPSSHKLQKLINH